MRRIPGKFLLDVRGQPIEIGSRVAYNLSGDVAIGEVVTDWPPFRIRLQHRAAGMPAGHISVVRSRTSIIVLTPEDTP